MGGRDRNKEDEDRDIIGLCRKGDIDAFEVLLNKYQKKMFNIAYRITGDPDEAAEVVQDAFFSAYKGLKGFERKSLFSTWLYAITLNSARNRFKQMQARRRRETASLDDPSLSDSSVKRFDPPSDEPSAIERMEKKEIQRNVQKCLNRLDSEFREVIVLRDIQGFSYEEISAMLTLAEGTVKSRLFRARESMKNCLKKIRGEQ
jgi:RNA polymerase sigma-70 factor (ECF subfamily)